MYFDLPIGFRISRLLTLLLAVGASRPRDQLSSSGALLLSSHRFLYLRISASSLLPLLVHGIRAWFIVFYYGLPECFQLTHSNKLGCQWCMQHYFGSSHLLLHCVPVIFCLTC